MHHIARLTDLLPAGLEPGQRNAVALIACIVLYGLLITRSKD